MSATPASLLPPPDAQALPGRWQLRLLGTVELGHTRAAKAWQASGPAALLLGRLALAPHSNHPREELVERLWPGVALDVGRNRLRQLLAALRERFDAHAAPPLLFADRHSVRLAADAVDCDLADLNDALRRRDLAAARVLYRGELMPGCQADWVIDERHSLAARVERLEAETAAGSASAALGLPVYLTRWHGLEAASAALREAVLRERLVLLRGPGGVGKTRLAVEVALTFAADGQARGAMAGTPRFDAVVFVPLAGCSSASAMADAVQRVLQPAGGAGHGPASERVLRALAGRRVLLVLDNFEHLVEAARGLLAGWLARQPALHLLVTSRRVLGIDGEHELTLAALPLPAPQAPATELAANPAAALFVDRLRAVRRDFRLSADNAAEVVAIVRALHGLPLAIELAAARGRSLGLAELRAMLVQPEPAQRLALLERGTQRAADDPRQASMLAVARWSIERLEPAALALLQALAVFDGGATLATATAMQVLPRHEVAGWLDELVASSLVYTRDAADGRLRYHVFESVLDGVVVLAAAGVLTRLQGAHLRAMASWTATLGNAPDLRTVPEEAANLAAAWRHAAGLAGLAGADGEAAARLGLTMAIDLRHALDDVSPGGEALDALQTLAAAARGPASARCRVWALLATQRFERGERDAAAAAAREAEALLGADDRGQAETLHALARIAVRVHGDTEAAGRWLARATDAARDEPALQARLQALAGVLAIRTARGAACKLEHDRRALALWQAHGPPTRLPEGMVNLALALGFLRRTAEELQWLERALPLARAHHQHRLEAFILSVRGYALADSGDWAAAILSYRECITLAWSQGAWREWFYALWNLPRALAHLRQPERAALILGFAERFAAEHFGQLGATDLFEQRRSRRLVRALVGAEEEARLWHEGRALEMAAVMRLAMTNAQTRDAVVPRADADPVTRGPPPAPKAGLR